jgi:electron transfer flavoprotein alpha subunit
MSVLVVAEHVRGKIRDITLELITAGLSLGPVTVAVIAKDPLSLVDEVNVAGVSEIVTVEITADEFENDAYQAAVEALISDRRPDVTLLGFTVNSMGYGPGLAAKLDLGFASDVHGVALEGDAVVAVRSFYGSKVSGQLDFPGASSVLLMLRPTAWPQADGVGDAPTISFGQVAVQPRARHIEIIETMASGDVDITQAEFLLSIGRGVGEEENVEMFKTLADKMGAQLSVSRPLVDAGWAPASRQVGQSGRTVKPTLYLAFGISGAVQHLAGMKESGTIIAVNTDPEAAIFSVAHYGATADLFDVAEELEKLF